MNPYLLELPFPPSLNDYYLNRKAKVKRGPSAGKVYMARMISPEGLAFRGRVVQAVREGHRIPPRLSGRLAIVVLACPPSEKADGSVNNNRRDLDNLWKCLLDSLTHAEVMLDDALYDDNRIVRGNPQHPGKIWVSILPFDPDSAFAAVRAAGITAGAFTDLLA